MTGDELAAFLGAALEDEVNYLHTGDATDAEIEVSNSLARLRDALAGLVAGDRTQAAFDALPVDGPAASDVSALGLRFGGVRVTAEGSVYVVDNSVLDEGALMTPEHAARVAGELAAGAVAARRATLPGGVSRFDAAILHQAFADVKASAVAFGEASARERPGGASAGPAAATLDRALSSARHLVERLTRP